MRACALGSFIIWADHVLGGQRATLGPPWSKDHMIAFAATIAAS